MEEVSHAPTVICIKKANLKKLNYADLEDWLTEDDTLYIGRTMEFYVPGAAKSKWANPYTVKKYGLSKCLKLYRQHIIDTPELLDSLSELTDKTLGCWCATHAYKKSKPKCHGDILIELWGE